MQFLTSEMLKLFGVGDILLCENSQEAIDVLKITQARTTSRHINRVDIIVTDWLMPEGSGEELVTWVRNHKNDEVRFMPILVVSGYTTEKVTNVTRDMGANEILVKPISGKLLASRICAIIDHPRPFIQASDFFGPDRRRQNLPYKGNDRRTQAAKIVEQDI